MKVLVKNGDTGFFLKEETRWTKKDVEAQDFGSSLKAMEQAHAVGLTHAEIVISFGNPSLDINIPLHQERTLHPG